AGRARLPAQDPFGQGTPGDHTHGLFRELNAFRRSEPALLTNFQMVPKLPARQRVQGAVATGRGGPAVFSRGTPPFGRWAERTHAGWTRCGTLRPSDRGATITQRSNRLGLTNDPSFQNALQDGYPQRFPQIVVHPTSQTSFAVGWAGVSSQRDDRSPYTA